MTARTLHLVFKTHLDIGFTDHAEKVRQLYHRRFIPQAIETGEHFFAEDPGNPKFIWTTGAWLIHDYLATQPPEAVARLEAAIQKGVIRWHGLPFTTHTELMSPALFTAGLSFSGALDARFGKTTIAAKMTDVPGHTLGMVPLLAEAGIRFLHLGVNTACPVPEVPPIFRWRAPEGSEVVVVYQNSYGETLLPEGLADGLSFAHTNDNMGPQAIHQTVEIYRQYRHRFPDAAIRGATLEDFGAILWDARKRFPVVEAEIGDSWIHGAAADPIKAARFRALQRVYDGFSEELTEARRAFGRGLTLVAEHTCGVDIKTFLRDETAWDRPDFEAARRTDYRFGYAEASWAEQRGYLDAAVAELEPGDRKIAEAALAELAAPAPVALSDAGDGAAPVGDWRVRFDGQSGDILALIAPDGGEIGGRTLFGYRHESYDADDVQTHMDSYLIDRPEWAILDHAKPGLKTARTAKSAVWAPTLEGMATDGDALVLGMAMPQLAQDMLGAPGRIEYRLSPKGDGLEIAVALRGKPANRMPEAGFVHFTPDGANGWQFLKMGLWHDPQAIATHGGGQLQGVFAVRCGVGDGEVTATPFDTPLVGPAGWPFMAYNRGRPDCSAGVRFCLYTNKWGTNFPMWWEGDFLARFGVGLGSFDGVA